MDRNWYIGIDGVTHGPYTWNELYNMAVNGSVRPTTQLYHDQLGKWVEARTINELGFTKKTIPTKTKKKHGCRNGCLTFIVVLVLVALGLGFFGLRSADSGDVMIATKGEVLVAEEEIGIEGGIITVMDTESQMYGFEIKVPEGAYQENQVFKISTKEIKDHDYGDAFNPVTPLIHVDNGGGFSEEFMEVRIPVELGEDQIPLAFYYNDDGSLEVIPMLAMTEDEVILGVRHFSNLVVTAMEKALIREYLKGPDIEVDIDSGYKPMEDNWSFTNYGSEGATGGACAGMSLSSIYYYKYYKRLGQPSLYTLYDNNHDTATPEFWIDDSMGIRLTGTVQEMIDWASFDSLCDQVYHNAKLLNDEVIFYQFAYAFMLSKGDPQPIGLYERYEKEGKMTLSGGHAMVAYAIDETGISICDPNHPTRMDLKIKFDGKKLGTYDASTVAGGDEHPYNSFGLMGTSSLYPTSDMDELFSQMEDEPLYSEIGDQIFSNPYIYIWLPDGDEIRFESDISRIVLEEEDMINYKKKVIDQLELEGFTRDWIPNDWGEKTYLLIEINPGDTNANKSRIYSFVNNATSYRTKKDFSKRFLRLVALKDGINNYGYFMERYVLVGEDEDDNDIYKFRYTDFIKSTIQYGDIDLTGTWNGSYQITEYGKAMDYSEGIAYQITKGIYWVAKTMFGIEEKSEQELRGIANDSIEENPHLLDEKKLTLTLSNKEGNRYDADFMMETEEAIFESETEAVFDGENLLVEITGQDGSVMTFRYEIKSKDNLKGWFDMDYGSIGGIMSGDSELSK